VEARAAELKEAAVGHEARGAEAAAELGKANTLLEKMTVRGARAGQQGERGMRGGRQQVVSTVAPSKSTPGAATG
jgi:hypothetical protein